MKKNFLILLAIVFLGLALRIYQLDTVPPSASLDEASIGWNAYSILYTGKDEYGYKFPILLRAYDDWRPAFYVYLVIPFIKLLGLNVWAVRLPSIILSTLSIFSAFYLIKSLFISYKEKEKIALLSSLFLAISPWSIYISRLGHETNAGFAFGIFAVTFFLLFINSLKKRYIYFSSIFLALSFYAYQSEKVFIPLFSLILVFLFRKELLRNKKHLFFAFLIGFIILIPVLKSTFSQEGLSRFKGTSVYDVNAPDFFQASLVRRDARARGDLLTEIKNNNRIIYLRIVSKNYISHFNPIWLFTDGVSSDFKAPGSGLLNLFQLPLILLGLIYLFKRFNKSVIIFIVAWLLISPMAAAITTGSPHAMRSYSFLPIWQILGALGSVYIINLIKNNFFKKTAIIIMSILVITNCFYFLRQYFIFFPRQDSISFQYALSQAIPYVLKNERSYKKIVISNRRNLYQSYMFFLFYSKFDPVLYQRLGGTNSGGYDITHAFLKYEFRPILSIDEEKDVLYIRNFINLPKEMKIVRSFNSLNGEKAVIAVVRK